jgi:protoporphyrinogen oxidase
MIVIIGAGISGLTVARNLDKDYIVLEKEDYIGGLSTQYPANGYWFDFGGHYFHFQDKAEIKEYLFKFCKFKEFRRKSKTFLLDRYIPFPLQHHLSFLPSPLKSKILKEILDNKQTSEDDLHHFLETQFGNTLFQLFFQPFLSKYYNVDLRSLSAGMDKGSIPVPDKEQIAAGFKGKTFLKTGYNPLFYYPVPSLRHFIKQYAQDVEHRIHLNREVIEIDCDKKRVKTNDGTFHYDSLVTTMPLNHLLKIIKPRDRFPSAQQLHHISTLVVNAVLERKRKRFHWTYLPEKEFPFYRVGFYPVHPYPACYLERTVLPAISIDKKAMFHDISFTLKKLKVIEHSNEIVYFNTRIIPVSYIIFTRNWKTTVPPLLGKLKNYNIYSIGRYGSWNYTSMSDDIKTARGGLVSGSVASGSVSQ